MDKKHRVLIVSNRLLVAEGLASLLDGIQEVGEVEIAESLYEARHMVAGHPPDVLLIDLPPGAEYFIDRPMEVDGREIKTIVIKDDRTTGEARLYVYDPAVPANLKNLTAAVLYDPSAESTGKEPSRAKQRFDRLPAVPVSAQPTSLIRARASGPSNSRISSSRREV